MYNTCITVTLVFLGFHLVSVTIHDCSLFCTASVWAPVCRCGRAVACRGGWSPSVPFNSVTSRARQFVASSLRLSFRAARASVSVGSVTVRAGLASVKLWKLLFKMLFSRLVGTQCLYDEVTLGPYGTYEAQKYYFHEPAKNQVRTFLGLLLSIF